MDVAETLTICDDPINAYKIEDYECPREHRIKTARFIYKDGKPLCFYCIGKDRIIKELLKILGGKCEVVIPDEQYEEAMREIPELRQLFFKVYRFTCREGHSWTDRFGNFISGNWCKICLFKQFSLLGTFQQIAENNGGRILSTEMNTELKAVCNKKHLFERHQEHLIKGLWCDKCDFNSREDSLCLDDTDQNVVLNRDNRIFSDEQSLVMRRETELIIHIIVKENPKEVVHIKYHDIENPYEIVNIECDRGHFMRTSPYMLFPEFWCRECDGASLVKRKILHNTGGSMTILVIDGQTFESISENEKWGSMVSAYCKYGHRIVNITNLCPDLTLYSVTFGKWCSDCLDSKYQTKFELQQLAIQKGGKCIKYVKDDYNRLRWECTCRSSFLLKASEVVRGEWCPYCYDRGILPVPVSEKYKKKVENQARNYKPKEDRCDEIAFLDKGLYLTPSQIIKIVSRFSIQDPPLLLFRARHDTIEKIKDLANDFGGECLNEEFRGYTIKLKWKCNEDHEGQTVFWEASLDSIYRGKWCCLCLHEGSAIEKIQITKGILTQHAKTNSRGEYNIFQYLKNMGIKFKTQYTFVDLKDIKLLRFDFCVFTPEGIILIEFDGIQHFQPVEYFGGFEGFKKRVLHDKMKSDYCLKNKIRLLRVNNFETVAEDLTKLASCRDVHVMYTKIDPKYGLQDYPFPKTDEHYYANVQFK